MFCRSFSFIAAFLIPVSLLAQTDIYTSINQTVPPSPTATSLGQYGNYTLNDYTGMPKIDIPLLDIQLKDFHLPISLSYAAGGVRVEDIPSWVGLGWSLNTGGIVTRSLVDKSDDNSDASSLGILHNDWYKPGYHPNWSVSWLDALDPFPGGTSPQDIVTLLEWLRAHRVDTEPDIFYYDVNGESGKFMFGLGNINTPLNQRIVMVPYRDISINPTLTPLNQTWPGTLNQFLITDEKGNRYFFDVYETSQILDNAASGLITQFSNSTGPTNDFPAGSSATVAHPFYRSAWYLSKIITVNNDEIDYTYADESLQYDINSSKRGIMYTQSMNMTDAQGCAMDYSGFWSTGAIAEDNLTMAITAKRLASISGPNFRVDFIANQARQDIANSQALTSIILYSYANNIPSIVKQFSFSYHYMTSDLSHPQLQSNGNYGDSRFRLLLDTVNLVDQTGAKVSNYNFQYNSAISLPDRLSPHKDFWGYFCNNQCNTAFPKLYIYPNLNFNPDVDNTYYPRYSVLPYNSYEGTTVIMPGANRNTDPVAILSGTLNRITFPTGGYTNFTLEPHTFNYYNQNYIGGGLRLKQTLSYDGINHANDIVKNYSYLNTSDNTNSSGVLFNLPVFAYAENAWMNYPGSTTRLAPPDPNYYSMNLIRTDISQATLSGFDATNVGYREITESQPGNGKIVRRYGVPGNYGMIADYTSDGACDINQSGYCDGYFQATFPTTYTFYNASCGYNGTAETEDLSGIDPSSPYTFPFAPTTNYDWNRGLILQEAFYNNANTLQKNISYSYQLYTPSQAGPQIITAMKKGRLMNYEFYLASGIGTCGLDNGVGIIRYDVLAPYQILGQVKKVPSQVQTTEYDNNGNAFTNTTTYTYSFNSLMPSSVQTDRSDKSSIIVNNKYVPDLNLSQSSSLQSYLGYQNLLNSHIIYEPVEQYVQKKNTNNSLTVIDGIFNTFKPGVPKPDVSYNLRTTTPLTDFSPSSISSTAVTHDSRYQPVTSYDSYDGSGNILQQTKVNDLSRSYIWDYKSLYPIAEIRNATRANVAYTSFEADGLGGWAPNSTIRIAGSGITGNQSYDLHNGTISCGLQDVNTTYVVSYWSNTGGQLVNSSSPNITGMTVNGWTYYEHKVTGATFLTVSAGSGGGALDELRLYPQGALMSTYTYTPMIGVTTSCDANNKITYYEYDSFGRLKLIRDQERNILQTFKYQYKEQQ